MFVDVHGFRCADWRYAAYCADDAANKALFVYSVPEIVDIVAECPESCGMCANDDDDLCVDDIDFVDESGYSCSDWGGVDCAKDGTTLYGYTKTGVADVLQSCPKACGLCKWDVFLEGEEPARDSNWDKDLTFLLSFEVKLSGRAIAPFEKSLRASMTSSVGLDLSYYEIRDTVLVLGSRFTYAFLEVASSTVRRKVQSRLLATQNTLIVDRGALGFEVGKYTPSILTGTTVAFNDTTTVAPNGITMTPDSHDGPLEAKSQHSFVTVSAIVGGCIFAISLGVYIASLLRRKRTSSRLNLHTSLKLHQFSGFHLGSDTLSELPITPSHPGSFKSAMGIDSEDNVDLDDSNNEPQWNLARALTNRATIQRTKLDYDISRSLTTPEPPPRASLVDNHVRYEIWQKRADVEPSYDALNGDLHYEQCTGNVFYDYPAAAEPASTSRGIVYEIARELGDDLHENTNGDSDQVPVYATGARVPMFNRMNFGETPLVYEVAGPGTNPKRNYLPSDVQQNVKFVKKASEDEAEVSSSAVSFSISDAPIYNVAL